MKRFSPRPSTLLRWRTFNCFRLILLTLLVTSIVAAGIGISSSRITHVSAAKLPFDEISQQALDQIQALIAAKLARTPAQQKIDSNLLAAIQMYRGEPVAEGMPTIETGISVEADGRVKVDIDAKVTEALLKRIQTEGGEVLNSFPQYKAIRAYLFLEQIEALAGHADVHFIGPAVEAEIHRADIRNPQPPAFRLAPAPRRAAVRAQLQREFAKLAAQSPYTGTVTSAGDVAHKAAPARTGFGLNGSGVKIGVLSNSFNFLGGESADITSGNLPGPGNPNGFSTAVTIVNGDDLSGSCLSDNNCDEGRAMLQIVHDLAPGAQLYFAIASNGVASFAANIQALRTAGCDIIIDDVLYLNESPFQDGPIAQAVNAVTAAGALYFSSAGNNGNKDDGTSGAWEGDFLDGGANPLISGGTVHNFGGGNLNNQITQTTSSNPRALLFWSDPLGGSSNDYDLFVLNSTATAVVAMSMNMQNGTQDPYEIVSNRSTGERLVVLKKSAAAARFLHLSCSGATLALTTAGTTRGHSCATDAFNVAAVNAATANGGAFVGGAANPVETFSSDGPRKVFYNANGTPITPGNFLASGGATRQKPDIAAADGVSTTLPPGNLNPFFGTSAAAPHAGAIAGLLKSFKPSLTAAQIRTILTSTALDIEDNGVDRDSGAGIVMAFDAIWSIAPRLTVTSSTPEFGVVVTASPIDANGIGSESTSFELSYGNNVLVTLTAPATAEGNAFQKWQKDGVDFSTNRTASLTMDANHTMNAVYVASVFRSLTVTSSNPETGVAISVDRPDKNGQSNGVTQFTRLYDNATDVILTAPATAGGMNFIRWKSGNIDLALNNPIIQVHMGSDAIMTAVYGTSQVTRLLTVASSHPETGVAITVSPNDNSGQGNGSTPFSRIYNNNTVVTMTAPVTADGKPFLKWQKEGIDYSFNRTISETMYINHSFTVIYTGKPFDFDSDAKADVAIWRPSNGSWYTVKSSNGAVTVTGWGTSGDMIVPGDYDGDGKTDVAVWRPSTGVWFILKSSNGATSIIGWGTSGDVPMPGDYDGDGKTDVAVWRPSNGTWYILKSSNGSTVIFSWGTNGDKPVAADYDADGKADIAVWRPSNGTWYIINSANGSTTVVGWGVASDRAAAGDYDGDGKADVAVWRGSNGTWYIRNSSNGVLIVVGWGANGDVPVPADYDGDGKTDVAVWRPSSGTWYIKNSSNGSTVTMVWGMNGDVPIPSAYVR